MSGTATLVAEDREAGAAAPAPGPRPFPTPADAGWRHRTERSFGRQAFMRYLGARIVALRPGHVEVAVDFDPNLAQQHGYFHGGVVTALADTASGYAAYSLLDRRASNVTVELKLSFLAPAQGTRLLACGTVLKAGRTLTVCRSDVLALDPTTHQQILCATALATFMALGRPELTD